MAGFAWFGMVVFGGVWFGAAGVVGSVGFVEVRLVTARQAGYRGFWLDWVASALLGIVWQVWLGGLGRFVKVRLVAVGPI